ncbi:peroxisome biogenesis factor 2 isoform X3 [Phyllobates terribilis]|uniref:peroxisome biogenesis factor 2 isoform X3 n=1 Tax=Phyllobates terribilis TaxID=111132 RepID=UPI003CCB0ECF
MQHGCKKEIRRVAQRTMVQFLMDTKMDTYLFTYKKNVDFSGIRHRIIDIKIFCCLQSESTMCTFQKKKKSHFMNRLWKETGILRGNPSKHGEKIDTDSCRCCP